MRKLAQVAVYYLGRQLLIRGVLGVFLERWLGLIVDCLCTVVDRPDARLEEYTNPIAWFTTIVGIITGASGYLMAAGFWPWA